MAFVMQPPAEGFEAMVVIDGATYRVRVMAQCKESRDAEQERRRIWRVMFYHLKSVYEAADSGVMEFRELMLPYIVMPKSGKTIAQHLIPKLAEAVSGNPARLLGDGHVESEVVRER